MSSATGNQMLPVHAAPGALSGMGAPAQPGDGPAEAGGMEMGDVLRILKQRKLIIIITTLVLYAAVVIATGITYKYFPGYRAEAVLEFTPPPDDPTKVFVGLADPKRLELQLQSEARKLKSLWLLQEVLALPEIKETSYYKSYHGDFQRCLYDLYDDVSAGAVRDTTLIRVLFSSRVPKESRRIVDSILDQYVKQSESAEQDKVTGKLARLRKTAGDLETELDQTRRDISAFRSRADVGVLETQRDVSARRMGDLGQEITLLETQAVDFETQLRAIEGIPSYELPVTPEMQLQVDADPIVRFRREQVEAIEIEVAALLNAGMFGPEHRQIKLLKARIGEYRQMLAARREELYDQLREQQVENLQQSLARIRNMQARLMEELSEVQAQQADLDTNIQLFESMVADRDRLEQQLATFEDQIAEGTHASNDPTTMRRLVIRQRAEVPPRPTFPNLYLFLGGGFVLSLLLGGGLAFLREFADQAVRTPIDVARSGRISVLGSIPELDDEEADIDEIETATRTAPQSLISESFRQVRTNLMFSGPPESQRSLLITSPGAGCGKSVVALNLAVVLAQSGQRVLLVDCNLRRPFVHTAFADARAEGLSNLLVGQSTFDQLVTNTEIPNLDVMTSGPLPPTPAELLSVPAMRTFIDEATEKYDRVVLDGPPVLLMSDALVLAAQVAGVIVVSRAATNSKGQLRRATDQLNRIGAHVLGGVLNGIETRAGGYFRRQYREFYDYVSDETVPPELPGAAPEAIKGETPESDDDPFADDGADDGAGDDTDK